jgi:hypothetical protein
VFCDNSAYCTNIHMQSNIILTKNTDRSYIYIYIYIYNTVFIYSFKYIG